MKKKENIKETTTKVLDMDGIPIEKSPVYINQKVVKRGSENEKIDFSKYL